MFPIKLKLQMQALVIDKLDIHAFTIDTFVIHALLTSAVENKLFPTTSNAYGVALFCQDRPIVTLFGHNKGP